MKKVNVGSVAVNIQDRATGWIENGRYYGYPECCITSFLTLSHVGQEPRKFDGTGFVPCKKCNETKTRAELIHEINSKRICKEPFVFWNETNFKEA